MKSKTRIGLTGLIITLLGLLVVSVNRSAYAAGTAKLYLTPASATFAAGATVDIAIHEDSGSDLVNAVQANLTYDSCLTYSSISSSSAFGIDAQSTGGSGKVKIARGTPSPVSGDQVVATVHFKQGACGPSAINFDSGSAVVRSTDNKTETVSTTGTNISLSQNSYLYLYPDTASYKQGSDVAVAIYEDSGTDTVNAVQANLNYTNNLTFTSVDTTGSAFSVQAQNNGGGGSLTVARGTTSPVSGPQLVATMHFKASGTGNAVITFANGSALVKSTDNKTEPLLEVGASYSITTTAPATPAPVTPPATPPAHPNVTAQTSIQQAPKLTSAKPSNDQSNPNDPPSGTSQPPVTTNGDSNAPQISDVQVTNVSKNSATVTWQTSKEATSEVYYGLDTQYSLSEVSTKLTKDHMVTLNPKNLAGDKTYHFQVKSVDAFGNLAISKDLTFKTVSSTTPSKYGSFWAAFAVIVIIGAVAYVGAGYIRNMKSQTVTPGPQGMMTGNTGRKGLGAIVKPEGTPESAPLAPNTTVTPNDKSDTGQKRGATKK